MPTFPKGFPLQNGVMMWETEQRFGTELHSFLTSFLRSKNGQESRRWCGQIFEALPTANL